MEHIPSYISVVFVLTTLLTVGLFYKATHYSRTTLLVLLIWLAVQAVVGLSGFYTTTDIVPPRFLIMVLPPVLLITLLFTTSKGRHYIDGFDTKTLLILHTIRIPVELVLFWLFVQKAVPELMTFEGRNFDILSGLTAPVVYYLGFIRNQLNWKVLVIWNLVCLGLLINIVANAVLSAPFPFQLFAFDQPNIAVLYFPFNWLPSCVVPLVLFSHLASLRQLWNTRPKKK